MRIEPAEYAARRTALAQAIAERGYAGALVVSRGGGTYDRFANVFYLTGHYQAWVYLPENPPLWSGRAHTALLMDAEGHNVLCAAVPEIDEGAVSADEIRTHDDWPIGVARTLDDLGLSARRVGVVGMDALPANLWLRLTEASPGTRFEPVDDLLETIRRVKSPAEQALIRAACAVGRRAVTAFLDKVQPGATETAAVAAAVELAVAEGAGIYMAAAASGPQVDAYAGTALTGSSRRTYERGDLVRFDLVVVRDGYLCDFGRTVVAGAATTAQTRLIAVAHAGLDAVIDAIRPAARVHDVVVAGDNALRDAGVAVAVAPKAGQPEAAYPPHWGHGLGLGWERPWLTDTEDLVIEEGMYLATERAVSLAGVGTVLPEQNLLVMATGAEVLTDGPTGRWS